MLGDPARVLGGNQFHKALLSMVSNDLAILLPELWSVTPHKTLWGNGGRSGHLTFGCCATFPTLRIQSFLIVVSFVANILGRRDVVLGKEVTRRREDAKTQRREGEGELGLFTPRVDGQWRRIVTLGISRARGPLRGLDPAPL